MKTLRKLLSVLAVLCLLLGVASVASATQYEYTIRIFPGNGSISGQTEFKVPYGGNYPDALSLASLQQNVTPSDPDKYYVKDVRLAGQDNYDGKRPVGTVKADEDYVVVYGFAGDLVTLSILYRDANGNQLRDPDGNVIPDSVIYGKAGVDRPIISAKFVDNYTCRGVERGGEFRAGRNFTGTITGDPYMDTWTFIYDPIPEPTPTPTPTPTPEGENQEGNENNENQENPEQTPPAEQPPEENIPDDEEIVDLDVPLAEPDAPGGPDAPDARKTHAGLIWGATAGVVGIAALLWYLLFFRKRKKTE